MANSFVLYRPKDIAAADCTGHGVPGAMVSVVCHNALNRAVREYKLTSPAAILDKVREIVVETFESDFDNQPLIGKQTSEY